MKKMSVIILIIAALIICAVGCAVRKNQKPKAADKQKTVEKSTGEPVEGPTEETEYKKAFGTYLVPAGWEENEEHSSDDNYFYVKAGTADKAQPDNVAVGIGSNPYQKDEHETFSRAIQQQIQSQIAGYEGTSMTGGGFTSEKGEIVYVFTISEEDTKMVTNQYYIVGEKQYCLVQESNFSGTDECDEAAKKIVNSFSFAE